MKTLFRNFLSLRKFDWVILLLAWVLVAIGLSALYSIDLSRGNTLTFFPTQLTAMSLGVVVFFIASLLHSSFYQASAKLSYVICWLFLLAVLFLGETIRGTRGWFQFFGLSFQPAELAKVGLILFSAWWIEFQGRRFDRWQFVLTSGFFTFLLVLLVLFQPDLGSAMILLGIWFGLLFLTGVKKRFIALLLVLFVIIGSIGWTFVLQNYQKDRFLTFIDSSRDPLGAGYNVRQSIIAIGGGQFFGRGLGFGSQSQLHFLPEAQTDFVFSVIAEELGFAGSFTVLVLYFLLLWRLLVIAKNAESDFGSYTVLGIILMFFLQILVNIGGATGFLPITGVTLPFLSSGGSSLLINFLLLGIVESIVRSRQST